MVLVESHNSFCERFEKLLWFHRNQFGEVLRTKSFVSLEQKFVKGGERDNSGFVKKNLKFEIEGDG